MKRTKIMLCGTLVVLLIINGSTVVHAQAGDPIQIEKEINIKAGERRLGKPASVVHPHTKAVSEFTVSWPGCAVRTKWIDIRQGQTARF